MRKYHYFLSIGILLFALHANGKVITPPAESTASERINSVHGVAVTQNAAGEPLPDVTGKLSLNDCIELALANSPSAVSAQLQKEAAKVALNLAKSEFLPTASAGASESYSTHKTDYFPTNDSHSSDVYASASLSIRGITEIARNVKMKQVALQQAELRFENVKNDIIRKVKKNYYALLSSNRAVEIRTQSRDVYKEQYERTSEYFRLGLRPKVDVTTAEVNLNNEELRLIRAKNAVKTASASLANVLGITTARQLDIEEIEDFDKYEISLEDAVQAAYANRPDVDASLLEVTLGQMKLNQAKAAYFPTFSFSAGFTKSGDTFKLDNEDARLSVGVELPLFNAFKTYNGVKQAQISLENIQNTNRSLLNDVFLEVQNAYIKMQEAAESIPIAELNVSKAKENLELAQGRYNEGIGDIIELKDAEAAYTDAEIGLLASRYDYGSAVADLKQAMGTY